MKIVEVRLILKRELGEKRLRKIFNTLREGLFFSCVEGKEEVSKSHVGGIRESGWK